MHTAQGPFKVEEYNVSPKFQIYGTVHDGRLPQRVASMEDLPDAQQLADKMVTAMNNHDDLVKALKDLLYWGRDYTSPTEPNSPYLLLIQACEALTKATGSC